MSGEDSLAIARIGNPVPHSTERHATDFKNAYAGLQPLAPALASDLPPLPDTAIIASSTPRLPIPVVAGGFDLIHLIFHGFENDEKLQISEIIQPKISSGL